MNGIDPTDPYVKLTQTPLARQFNFCYVSASKWLVILSLIYIVGDLSPGFYIAWVTSNEKAPAEIEERIDEKKAYNSRNIVSAVILISGIISFIGIIILLRGVMVVSVRIVFNSLWPLQLNTIFARILVACILYIIEMYDVATSMAIISGVDCVLVCLMIHSLGLFTGECRNKKYLKRGEKKINPLNESAHVNSNGNRYPPGSYPTQHGTFV